MSEEDKKIKIGKPAGFRDFYPEEFAKVNFILDTMRQISQEFGYVEYVTPTVELLKLYELKSGEGLLSETFKVESRSGQKLVLIPELTPSLSRMLTERQQYYTKPIRWFSLPRCYRDETLQRGRVKEFWQYNCDILGMEEIYADAEIITILIKVISACGLQKEQFVVLVNDRTFMQQFIQGVGISDPIAIIQLFDRKAKLIQERIEQELKGVFPSEEIASIALKIRHAKIIDEGIFEFIPRTKETEKIVQNFEQLRKDSFTLALQKLKLDTKQIEQLYELSETIDTPEKFLSRVKKIYPGNNVEEALTNLTQLTELLKDFKVSEYVLFDGSLARGLDYYTGIIFEAWSREGILPRAIAGGGRYADLVSNLGGQPLTGTGFGFGETVLMELLEEFNVKYPPQVIADVYIATIKLKELVTAIDLSNKLRTSGFKVILNPFDWKIKRHFENAESQKIEWLIIVGEKDLANNAITLRNIVSGEQEIIPLNQIIKVLQNKLKKK